jgi:hypothetical protein
MSFGGRRSIFDWWVMRAVLAFGAAAAIAFSLRGRHHANLFSDAA